MLTKEHAALRRIGGSDIGAVLGKSRWKTPLQVFHRLVIDPTADNVLANAAIDRGNFLEPGLRAWAGKKLDDEFTVPEGKVVTLKDWEWATYSPDGLGRRTKSVLEIKAPGSEAAAEWGAEMTAEVPAEHLLQGAWGCMVTDREKCFFAALIRDELRIFQYVRSMKLERAMLEKAREFVENHVLTGVPPEPTFGDKNIVYQMHPEALLPNIHWNELGETQRECVADYLRLRAAMDPVTMEIESKEARIRGFVGDHHGIEGIPEEFIASRLNLGTKKGAPKWGDVAQHFAFVLAMEGYFPPDFSNLALDAYADGFRGKGSRPLTLTRRKEVLP